MQKINRVMFHVIEENGKKILLCSGTMTESDYAMFKSESGIEKEDVRFVPQSVISVILDGEFKKFAYEVGRFSATIEEASKAIRVLGKSQNLLNKRLSGL